MHMLLQLEMPSMEQSLVSHELQVIGLFER